MIREDMKYDVRAMKHRLRRGDLGVKEVQKHLDALPDEASEGESTRTEFTPRSSGGDAS